MTAITITQTTEPAITLQQLDAQPIVLTMQTPNISATIAQIATISVIRDRYVHTQDVPSALWDIVHDLNMYPSVTCVDTLGREIEGRPIYIDLNHIQVEWGAITTGLAFLS